MATEDDVNSVYSKLDLLFRNFSIAFRNENMEECETALRRHFKTLCNAHARGVLPDNELTHYVSVWEKSVSNLSKLSPFVAFSCACTAWDICKGGQDQLSCDKLIVNTVAVYINRFAYGALNTYVDNQKMMDLNNAEPYVFALGNVLMMMASHLESHCLHEKYNETLATFKEILYSAFIPPTERYRHVKRIRDLAEANGTATQKLLNDMNGLLTGYGEVLPGGQGMILNPLERQADVLAAEHYLSTVKESLTKFMKNERHEKRQPKDKANIIPFTSALALRAGVPEGCTHLHQTIERSLRCGDYQTSEDSLFDLFNSLVSMPENTSAYTYLLGAADRLSSKSLTHGFQLASRCITAIEEEGISLEKLQETVYGFAVPAIMNWEEHDNSRLNYTKELNKAIMKRSSEFIESEQAGDIFESAAIGFREYLGSITPQQRYDELLELSLWLKDLQYPSLMMEGFVSDLMKSAKAYGSFMGIPLEEDTMGYLTALPALSP